MLHPTPTETSPRPRRCFHVSASRRARHIYNGGARKASVARALALPSRSIQYCCCWAAGGVTYPPVELSFADCIEHEPILSHHILVVTLTKHADFTRLHLLHTIPSPPSLWRSIAAPSLHSLARFCCSCNNSSPARESALLELLAAAPAAPILITTTTPQIRPSVDTPLTRTAANHLQSIPFLSIDSESIVFDACAGRRDRSVSAHVHFFPASSQAVRGPERQRPQPPRPSPAPPCPHHPSFTFTPRCFLSTNAA